MDRETEEAKRLSGSFDSKMLPRGKKAGFHQVLEWPEKSCTRAAPSPKRIPNTPKGARLRK